jgi:hypothetical protein
MSEPRIEENLPLTYWRQRVRLYRLLRSMRRLAGCSKRPSSKAAASEDARRTFRYVELLSEARTLLADFFSILLKRALAVRTGQ